MNLVYALLYDTSYNSMEISGLYSNLEAAKNAVKGAVWKKHESIAMWETITNEQYWCITVHAILER
jgi:hypothetical protein